jgi:hypothetical protein
VVCTIRCGHAISEYWKPTHAPVEDRSGARENNELLRAVHEERKAAYRRDSKVALAGGARDGFADFYRRTARRARRAPYTGPNLTTIQEQSNSAASEPSIPAGDDDVDSSPTAVDDEESPTEVDDEESPKVDDDESSPTVDDDKPDIPLKHPARKNMASAEWRTEVVAGPPSNMAPSPSDSDNPGHNALFVANHFRFPRKPNRASV